MYCHIAHNEKVTEAFGNIRTIALVYTFNIKCSSIRKDIEGCPFHLNKATVSHKTRLTWLFCYNLELVNSLMFDKYPKELEHQEK